MRGQKNDDVTRTDSAGVFADALGGETLLTLIGTRAVHIENYRSILVYTDTEIRIQYFAKVFPFAASLWAISFS